MKMSRRHPSFRKAALSLSAALLFLLLALRLEFGESSPKETVEQDLSSMPATPRTAATEIDQGFLYGRVSVLGDAVYEGRLRWGDGSEAFWSDSFNGVKKENPWATLADLPTEKQSFEIFGKQVAEWESSQDLTRPFAVRFGDLARIDAQGADVVKATLKSGTVVELDRFGAGDFDDGVRVWDAEHGVTDLESMLIRSIEFLPAPAFVDPPKRLYGTAETRSGERFTGFVRWNRDECFASDTLDGQTKDGEINLRYDEIRSLVRQGDDRVEATLLEGRRIVIGGSREAGRDHRGLYVDDPAYGRALIFWKAFERVDFHPPESVIAASGPAYDDFPPGRPLRGVVVDRSQRRLAGRLVFDLDESETTDTLDAPSRGVNYSTPFGRIASLTSEGRTTLVNGTVLQLESSGDLSADNAGMLIFTAGSPSPEYVAWDDVVEIEFFQTEDRQTEDRQTEDRQETGESD